MNSNAAKINLLKCIYCNDQRGKFYENALLKKGHFGPHKTKLAKELQRCSAAVALFLA